MINTISIEKALKLKDAVFIDTRSPKEFAEDNILGAISCPIFSDEERKEIGILYKKDQGKAFEKGKAIYESKVDNFIKKYKKFDKNKPIVVYCWRGGIRSETITKLIESLGYNAFQLVGGHKAFRGFIRDKLENYKLPFKLVVLQGLAGCGKTDLIKELKPSIDLEELAGHRSSLFGAIGLEPKSQKMFESRLWFKLEELKQEKTVFIEGEAKKIGNIFVPDFLFGAMQKAMTVYVNTSLKERVKRIVRDYFSHGEDEEIKNIISKLKVSLSNKVVEEMHKQVDNKEYEKVAEHLLVKYYDDRYVHANKDIKYSFEVNNDSVEKVVKELVKLL
ncbi:MAG: tRNA 2-selenouridine(34) synthase MnmH [archaeon]